MIYDTYHKYVYKASNITDITDWCSKKTVTKSVLEAKQTTQKKILAAIGDKHVQEGDKVYMFFKPDGSLSLREDFNGEYDKEKMFERVYKTMKIFENVTDVDLLPNYKLKRNKERI